MDGRRLSGLTEFLVDVPAGTPDSEVERRERAEAAAAANLARERHLARLWKPQIAPGSGRRSACIGPTAKPSSTVSSVPYRLAIGCGSLSRRSIRTPSGDLLYVQSRGVRHGPAEVLARLSRGEDVASSEYTFRAATQIDAASPDLGWLNKAIFVSVGGRQAANVIYETYLVG